MESKKTQHAEEIVQIDYVLKLAEQAKDQRATKINVTGGKRK